jgi:hypothetical protein
LYRDRRGTCGTVRAQLDHQATEGKEIMSKRVGLADGESPRRRLAYGGMRRLRGMVVPAAAAITLLLAASSFGFHDIGSFELDGNNADDTARG